LPSDLKQSIEERSVANQIENAYYVQKKDSIVPDLQTNAFFESLQKEYVLDDYTRFPTMKETITEVVTELYYTKKATATRFVCETIHWIMILSAYPYCWSTDC